MRCTLCGGIPILIPTLVTSLIVVNALYLDALPFFIHTYISTKSNIVFSALHMNSPNSPQAPLTRYEVPALVGDAHVIMVLSDRKFTDLNTSPA